MTPSTQSAPLSPEEVEMQWRLAEADAHAEMVARLKARVAGDVAVRLQMRQIADMVKAWDRCGRPACRRAGRCRTRGVPCFDEHREELQFRMEELAEWSRFDGPFENRELEAIGADMRAKGAPI